MQGTQDHKAKRRTAKQQTAVNRKNPNPAKRKKAVKKTIRRKSVY